MELKRASNSRKYDIGSLRAFDAFENTSKLDIPSFCTPKRSGTSGAVRRLMSTTSATCSSGAGSGDATDTGFWSLVMPSNLDYASSGDSDTSSSDRHEGAGAGSRLRDSVISRRRRQASVLSASRHSQGISSRKQSSILDNVNEDPAATAVILDSPRTPSRRSFGRCGLPRTPSSTGGRHRLSCRIPNPLFLSPKRSHSTGAGTCTGTAVGADEDVDVDASGKPQTRMERKLAFDETKWDHASLSPKRDARRANSITSKSPARIHRPNRNHKPSSIGMVQMQVQDTTETDLSSITISLDDFSVDYMPRRPTLSHSQQPSAVAPATPTKPKRRLQGRSKSHDGAKSPILHVSRSPKRKPSASRYSSKSPPPSKSKHSPTLSLPTAAQVVDQSPPMVGDVIAIPTVTSPVMYEREPTNTWQCQCGYSMDKKKPFCGMCGTKQFWTCQECACQNNLCIFHYCGDCGCPKTNAKNSDDEISANVKNVL